MIHKIHYTFKREYSCRKLTNIIHTPIKLLSYFFNQWFPLKIKTIIKNKFHYSI